MMRRNPSRRDAARAASSRSVRPTLECLEDRQLLASLNGGEWTYGNRITYSFIPDGTSIGGISSNLYQTLNSKFSTAAWQQAFERAAAVWEQVANINLTLVSDDGTPVGNTGDQQDDPRFGDIRIGAYGQSSGQLAVACLPPPINGGTDAGDIFINSNVAWKINNDYDLQTVAIHEIGHALGLGHSSISSAVMYASYTGMKQSLNSDDTTGIQAVYGGVAPDQVNNGTASSAVDLTPYLNGQGQAVVGGQAIATASQYDWFKVQVPSTTTGTMVVSMQSSNLSSLSPRLAVFNSSLGSVGQVVAANSYGSMISYTVPNVSPGQVYYFRSSAANTGPSSNGSYGLVVNFGSTASGQVAPPNTVVTAQPDQGGGSSAMQSGSTSSGGLLGLGGLSLSVNLLGIEVAVKLQIGTLSVYAEPLKLRALGAHQQGHAPNVPAGPAHHQLHHAHHHQLHHAHRPGSPTH